jgi:hypothetical protein
MQFALVTQGHPYAAAVGSVNGELAGCDRITFTTQATRPMRVSVQVRTGRSGVPDERWQRAVYADDQARRAAIDLSTFTPIGSRTAVDAIESMHEIPGCWTKHTSRRNGTPSISDVTLTIEQ